MKTDSKEQLLADVDAYCQELRPIEELCYVEHRFNDQDAPIDTQLEAIATNPQGPPVTQP